jgi:hypothetical protein
MTVGTAACITKSVMGVSPALLHTHPPHPQRQCAHRRGSGGGNTDWVVERSDSRDTARGGGARHLYCATTSVTAGLAGCGLLHVKLMLSPPLSYATNGGTPTGAAGGAAAPPIIIIPAGIIPPIIPPITPTPCSAVAPGPYAPRMDASGSTGAAATPPV